MKLRTIIPKTFWYEAMKNIKKLYLHKSKKMENLKTHTGKNELLIVFGIEVFGIYNDVNYYRINIK